jgi:signal transduction histidine kinase
MDTQASNVAEEQSALRRVATLVARGAPTQEVSAAVGAEVGRLLGADLTAVGRYGPDDLMTVLGAWSGTGPLPITVGSRVSLGGKNLATLIHQTRQPARIDDYDQGSGAVAEVARRMGFRSAVGVPISVAGHLWGLVAVMSARTGVLPADTEARLAGFTELAATAVANAEAQAALAASRARIVVAADEARRRIQRDLHDGAQQRLVTLALRLRELQAVAPPEAGDLVDGLDEVITGLEAALEELREIARGIHPAVLAHGGLLSALQTLARRCPIPVDLQVQVTGRLPGPVEIAIYYVICEALANAAKHADASVAVVTAMVGDGVLRASVRDDGCGGADFGIGSGLIGVKDRVEALGGHITLHSPPGTGTTLEAHIPLGPEPARGR